MPAFTSDYVEVPRKVWTREEAHLLADMGLPNANRLELIDGDLIDRLGKKHPHVLWQTLAHAWLISTFGAECVLFRSPTDVSEEDNPTNEPEPDLMVTQKSVREYVANPSPQELRLVVEVADSTLSFDLKVKARLYARAAIIEYWVIDIPKNRLIVHRDPVNGVYISVSTYASSEQVAPIAAPNARFCMDRL